MLCEICHKNQALIFYEERINNQVRKMHLCQNCAAKQGISDVFSQPFFNISHLLSSLGGGGSSQVAADRQLVCKNCRTAYDQFVKNGLLGCSHCYNYFEDQLQPLFRRIHGATQHVGKEFAVVMATAPPSSTPPQDASVIAKLETELKKAVKDEEFELAAKLRDKIRQLKKHNSAKTSRADDHDNSD